jgi:hypothetical protein
MVVLSDMSIGTAHDLLMRALAVFDSYSHFGRAHSRYVRSAPGQSTHWVRGRFLAKDGAILPSQRA